MLSRVFSSTILGIDAYIVEAEAHLTGTKLPRFVAVGSPEGLVKESKKRVTAAIRNSGYFFPRKYITINLAPTDIRKEGFAFDLPIAIVILAATGMAEPTYLDKLLLLGELALDGYLRPIKGAFPIAICARNKGYKGLILPNNNAKESGVVDGVKVVGFSPLQKVVDNLNEITEVKPIEVYRKGLFSNENNYSVDFADVKGQEQFKRALEVAVA